MSEEKRPFNLIQIDEASRFAEDISDERIQAFVRYGLTTILLRRGMDPNIAPKGDFDLRFFVEILQSMAGNFDTLSRICQNEDLSWWSDDVDSS